MGDVLLSVRDLTIALPAGLDREFAVHDISYDLNAGEIRCVAARICNRIAVMLKGEVVEEGPPEQVIDKPQYPYIQRLIAAIPGAGWNPRAAVPVEVVKAANAPDAPAL